MLTFISCAKTMTARTSVGVPEITVPYFQAEAVQNALDMGTGAGSWENKFITASQAEPNKPTNRQEYRNGQKR